MSRPSMSRLKKDPHLTIEAHPSHQLLSLASVPGTHWAEQLVDIAQRLLDPSLKRSQHLAFVAIRYATPYLLPRLALPATLLLAFSSS
jgi:hypothetical protein